MLPMTVLKLCATGIQARDLHSDASTLPYQGFLYLEETGQIP